MIDWLAENDIKYLPRQLDHSESQTQFNYEPKQVVWFNKLYSDKGTHQEIKVVTETTDLARTGRACCGGRELGKSQN